MLIFFTVRGEFQTLKCFRGVAGNIFRTAPAYVSLLSTSSCLAMSRVVHTPLTDPFSPMPCDTSATPTDFYVHNASLWCACPPPRGGVEQLEASIIFFSRPNHAISAPKAIHPTLQPKSEMFVFTLFQNSIRAQGWRFSSIFSSPERGGSSPEATSKPAPTFSPMSPLLTPSQPYGPGFPPTIQVDIFPSAPFFVHFLPIFQVTPP